MICERLFFACVLMLVSGQVLAFYNWQGETSQGDARLLLRGFVIASQQADNPQQQGERNDEAAGGLARLIIQSVHEKDLAFEVNAYQTWIDHALVDQQNKLGTVLDVERSGALEWSLSDSEYAHLAVDRLNARWSGERFNVTFGRQAINLATTFFFSPNDFFAPFAAQAFYRVYKPGVDGIRGELSLGELHTLSFIGVLGYTQQVDADSGWSDEPDSSRDSWLVRYVTNLAGFEWGLVSGKVRRTQVQGASISGELFDWLGIRAEGHRAEDLDNSDSSYSDFTIGLEHRWENSLMLQFEQYYNGAGALQVDSYNLSQAYPARRYQALGLSYEFTPLWTGQASVLYNQIDYSRLYSLNAVYSLSNESELAMSLNIPNGATPRGTQVKSEFGTYPKIFNLEIRAYF